MQAVKRTHVGAAPWGVAALVVVVVLIAIIMAGRTRTMDTNPAALASQLSATSALLIEADSGRVLFAKNADRRLPPASLTKLMTVLLAMEAVDDGRAKLVDRVVVSRRAASTGGSRVWIDAGERFTLEQLLESAMIASANDSAVAVAEHLAGSEEAFVRRMSRRAQKLGMDGTVFVNATGLPQDAASREGYTTARDMACLAREVLRHPAVLEWSRVQSKVFRTHPAFVMSNTNQLVGSYRGCDGLKTGHTDTAGYHLVATARSGGVRLICVVMQAQSRESAASQAARLLDYGYRIVGAAADVKVLPDRASAGDLERVI
ncbi:MAG: D-alanyl-D-alanine carboxypeptidase family protein [Clostridia bacterium]|nr:D-alanyl-D-alanine carboxypeptidase family protein [Clostridia bacterium]